MNPSHLTHHWPSLSLAVTERFHNAGAAGVSVEIRSIPGDFSSRRAVLTSLLFASVVLTMEELHLIIDRLRPYTSTESVFVMAQSVGDGTEGSPVYDWASGCVKTPRAARLEPAAA